MGESESERARAIELLIDQAEHRRARVLLEAERARPHPPLRFLRQQAHYTSPASDFSMLEKAVKGGLAATGRVLTKLGIEPWELAGALNVPLPDVEAVLNGDPHAPVVVVDAEDAQALREDTILRGRANAVRAFRELDWGRTLRFYIPNGLAVPSCVRDVATVLVEAGAGRAPEDYPIDALIWPKVESQDEVAWLLELLDGVERAIGLPHARIKLELLIESARGLTSLPELVPLARDRLVGLIFGIADYSSEIGLREVRNDHPTCDAARVEIVRAAGAAGVPAIDTMTFNYPAAAKDAPRDENRRRVLRGLVECYRDALHGIELGMSGKWVGHPAQLAMVLLAFRRALNVDFVERELARVEAYRAAVEREVGATIHAGAMIDRATDRHSRSVIRRAVAQAALDPRRALAAGVISAEECAEVEASRRPGSRG